MSRLAFLPPAPLLTAPPVSRLRPGITRVRPCATATPTPPTYDVIIIGAGLSSLSAAALLSSCYHNSVLVLEAHSSPGGAAHTFTRRTRAGNFTFCSGPHLFSGLSTPDGATSVTSNPMQHVFRATDSDLPVLRYSTWGVWLPGGRYVATRVTTESPLFQELITTVSGEKGAAEVASLLRAMEPLCRAATALPPAALRAGDVLGSLRVASRYMSGGLVGLVPYFGQLSGPFGPLLRKHVKDEFARRFLELLCFLLAGVTADRIPTAEVAFMFAEWGGMTGGVGEGLVLEHPVGGSGGVVDALVEAIERGGRGEVRTGVKVERILVEGQGAGRRATGVEVAGEGRVLARKGVVAGVAGREFEGLMESGLEDGRAAVEEVEMCESFMHLHLVVELTEEVRRKMPYELEVNYASVEDWERGLEDEDNVVLVTIPSVAEPDKYPEGFAVLHAYTPATERFEKWEGLKRGSKEYEDMKRRRSEVLWRAVNRIFGQDVRDVAHVSMVGTPLTHGRFLNRERGSYGPKVDARKGGLGLPFGGVQGVKGLYRVGDSVFPGVGVPAVAASGWMAANAFASVEEHVKVLDRIGL